nr:cell differentiation protein RCD1-like [Tanacetum cinerariifolium]
MKEATRVCNAVALFQVMASHPDMRMEIVKGVIGALVKVEDKNSPQIIHFLLDTEVIPLCLRCIEVGSEPAKTVAAFVISKILTYEEGQRYCGTFPERFYAISKVLGKALDEYLGKPLIA